jgi:hypothetical protein
MLILRINKKHFVFLLISLYGIFFDISSFLTNIMLLSIDPLLMLFIALVEFLIVYSLLVIVIIDYKHLIFYYMSFFILHIFLI